MITLVMISGGLDSTFSLVRLLRETDDEILAHHIHMMTDTGRYLPEAESCRRIVKYCETNFRPFSYTESAIDHRRFAAHGVDLVAAGLVAGAVASSYHRIHSRRVDRWVLGRSAEETARNWRFRMARNVCEYNCQFVQPPELYFPEPRSQQEQVDYLPPELFEMTWSCRFPRKTGDTYVPCGKCSTCERLDGLSHALTPEHNGANGASTGHRQEIGDRLG